MGDEGAHHGARHFYAFLGLQQDAGLEGEIEMAGDAAELQAEVNARLEPGAAGDLARHEADVVGVLEHRHAPAAVEGDVELARQAVHLAVIEDVVVHGAAERPRVVDFLRVDAGGRAAGDVADIVGARAARGEAQRLHRQQHVDGVRRADLADLQVGAGRHIGIAAAEGVGGIGQAAHLPGAQDAVGDAQAAHEGVLRRSDVEEALILGQEDVDALGELPCLGAARPPRPSDPADGARAWRSPRRPACRPPPPRGPGRRIAARRGRWAGPPAQRARGLPACRRPCGPRCR